MKIVFDFDHTLFSAKRLYLEIKDYFDSLGISCNLFNKSYQESKKEGKTYDPKKQFEIIHKEKPEVSIKEMEENSEEIMKRFPDFVYPDVVPFLEEFKDRFDFYIISYGGDDGSFSREKIKRSGIGDYFEKVFVTKSNDKTNALKEVIDGEEELIFIDDSPEVLSEIKKYFPEVTTVRINRGEGKYKDQSDVKEIDFSIKDLEELRSILTEL